MTQPLRALALGAVIVWVLGIGPARATAQAPTVNPDLPSPGSQSSTMGTIPGSGGSQLQSQAGAQYLGGRPGPTSSRAPTSVSNPNVGAEAQNIVGINPPPDIQPATAPIFGSLALPDVIDTEGPADGMTIDAAIARLIKENLTLKGNYMEIPQARADILTASLRSNPVFYADAQLVPYGVYSNARPGGQTQYDVNISYPLDVTRKRAARTVYACRALKVLEAQYADAVRQQVDNLYTTWVDVLNARGIVRFSEKGVEGLENIYATSERLFKQGEVTKTQLNRAKIQLDTARIGLLGNQATYRQAKRALGVLLSMTPQESEAMEIRGTLKDTFPAPPEINQLIKVALASRPDVSSYRLGISLAESNVRLAKANILQDVYLLYQPYTLQDNTYQGLKSPTSWAVGITVPVPVYNRNQGVIQRAKLNVTQSQIQLSAIQNSVVTEVRQSEQAYYVSLETVKRYEAETLPDADAVLKDSERLFRQGEIDVIARLTAQREYNDIARTYLDALVAHRRSMLSLNTSLAQRILP